MKDAVPIELKTEINCHVLRYLEGRSAHSDVADALRSALKPLGDVHLYCPDWHHCHYVAASTLGIIMAIAVGTNTVGFRLDDRMKARALACGAASFSECGDGWVSFTLFQDDWPKVDLEFWARKAYVTARS